jgi:parallel beta-helix repeat protein
MGSCAHGWQLLALITVVLAFSAVAFKKPESRERVPEQKFEMPGMLTQTGKHFDVKDSKFLNFHLDSSRAIDVTIQSVPNIILIRVEGTAGAASTTMTMRGLKPSTAYHKYEDTHRNHIAFNTDSDGKYNWTQDLSKAHLVFIKPSESTKYIGGPNGQDCSTIGAWNASSSTCTLTQNVSDTIEIVSNGVTIDGAGYAISPPLSCNGIGVHVANASGVTIRNLIISQFSIGILLWQSSSCRIQDNILKSCCGDGIVLDTCAASTLARNTAENDNYGIFLQKSNDNTLTRNVSWNNANVGFYLGQTSGHNILDSNIALINKYGIVVNDHSTFNRITCNTLKWNYPLGIGFYVMSVKNTVSHNNFYANTLQQAYVDSTSNANSFDLFAANTGNYWKTPPANYVSPFTFAGGVDHFPLANPQLCQSFVHCNIQHRPRIDLSTGTITPFVAASVNSSTADNDWKIISAPNASFLGPATTLASSNPWVGSPFVPIGPPTGVANWVCPPNNTGMIGIYSYECKPAGFAGPGTLVINGFAADDLADLYLDSSPTPLLSGACLYWLSPLTPLSIQVTTPGQHVLIAKVNNSVNASPTGLVVIAEFCPPPP